MSKSNEQKAVVVKAEVGAPKVKSLVTQVAIVKASNRKFNEAGNDAVLVTLSRDDRDGYSLIRINERSSGQLKDGPITLSINEVRAIKEVSEALVNGMFIES